jgi:hypothetical protein
VAGLCQFGIMQSAPTLAGDRMPFDQLKRRDFITLLGCAACAALAISSKYPALPSALIQSIIMKSTGVDTSCGSLAACAMRS